MVTKNHIEVNVRWMIRDDLAEVCEIENHSFHSPWSRDDFTQHLRNRNTIGMVAESSHIVIGYMIYELHSSTIKLLSIAVDKEYRHAGVGSAMVNRLIGKLTEEFRNRITAEVSERNLGAQMFFKGHDFRCVRVLKNTYEETDDDCYVMRHRLGENVSRAKWLR